VSVPPVPVLKAAVIKCAFVGLIAHCKSVANPWRDHFFAVLRGKIAVRSRISHYVCNNP
jgi:hypothetical protein